MEKIKKTFLLFSLITISIYFYSCSASVQLTSWKDPNSAGVKFSKIMVIAVVKDLAYKKAYEYETVKSLKEAGVNAVPSMEVFSPNKDYTEKEMIDIVNKNNINGVLTLKYTGTKIQKIVYGGMSYYQYYYDGESVLTSPSYVEQHKIANVECSLFSTSSGNAVWIAETKTSNYVSLKDLASSLADNVTADMVNEKIIP